MLRLAVTRKWSVVRTWLWNIDIMPFVLFSLRVWQWVVWSIRSLRGQDCKNIVIRGRVSTCYPHSTITSDGLFSARWASNAHCVSARCDVSNRRLALTLAESSAVIANQHSSLRPSRTMNNRVVNKICSTSLCLHKQST